MKNSQVKKDWTFWHSNKVTAEMEIMEDIRQIEADESALQKALGSMEDASLSIDGHMKAVDRDKRIHNSYVNVLAGYDNQYMSRNDFRIAGRLNNGKKIGGMTYRQYLESIAPTYKTAKEFMSPSTPKAEKEVTSCTIRKSKALPKATYVPSTASAVIRQPELKTSIPVGDMVYIRGYHFYREAVILEVERMFDINTRKYRREQQESSTFFYVFRYVPFDMNGRPNPNDGIKQLMTILRSIAFVKNSEPATLLDALNCSIDCIVELPEVPLYERCTSVSKTCKVTERTDRNGNLLRNFSTICQLHDNYEVFMYFGDIEEFDGVYTSQKYFNHPYEQVSEYSKIEEDEREWINEYESLQREIYADIKTKIDVLISYDCHKEFREPLPLELNHISSIFD